MSEAELDAHFPDVPSLNRRIAERKQILTALIVHGKNCAKIVHAQGAGYLHGENDNSPYYVDGVRYCGRCHHLT